MRSLQRVLAGPPFRARARERELGRADRPACAASVHLVVSARPQM